MSRTETFKPCTIHDFQIVSTKGHLKNALMVNLVEKYPQYQGFFNNCKLGIFQKKWHKSGQVYIYPGELILYTINPKRTAAPFLPDCRATVYSVAWNTMYACEESAIHPLE